MSGYVFQSGPGPDDGTQAFDALQLVHCAHKRFSTRRSQAAQQRSQAISLQELFDPFPVIKINRNRLIGVRNILNACRERLVIAMIDKRRRTKNFTRYIIYWVMG